MNNFTEERKKDLEKEIVDMAIAALDNGIITEDELGDVSLFILSRIDRIVNEDELKEFLQKLSEKWEFYKPLHQKQLGKEMEKKEERVVIQAEDLIKRGNIDEAIQIMKGGE